MTVLRYRKPTMNHIKLSFTGQVESAERRRALLSLPEVANLFAQGALHLLGVPSNDAKGPSHSQYSATSTESSLDFHGRQSGTGNRRNNRGVSQ